EPAFARSSSALNIPIGGMPLWSGIGDRGLEARIIGTRDRNAGWLRVFLDRQYDEFVALPSGACISRADPYGLCVNELETIEFHGVERPAGRFSHVEPGMPVGYSIPNLARFDRAQEAGRHELIVIAGIPFGVRFEDSNCNNDSGG